MKRNATGLSIAPLKGRIMWMLLVVLLGFGGAFGWMTFGAQTQAIDRSGQQALDTAISALPSMLDEQSRLLATMARLVMRDPALPRALQRRDRQALLDGYADLYKSLRADGHIGLFSFLAADRENLVRLAEPDQYGDGVDRFTVRQAQRTRAAAVGLELGPSGALALRIVQPVLQDQTLVGFVELGKAFDAILGDLGDQNGVEFAVTVSKDRIDSARREAGRAMPGREANQDLGSDDTLIYASHSQLPGEWRTALAQRRALEHTPGVLRAAANAWPSRVSNIRDASGAWVAKVHFFVDLSDEMARLTNNLVQAGSRSIGLAAIGLLVVFFLLGRVDRKIIRQHLALAQGEERLALVLDTLPHGVLENDTAGVITYSNLAYQKALGYGSQELTGRHIWDLQVDPQQARRAQARHVHMMTSRPVPEPYVIRQITKDNREVVLEVTWNYQRNPAAKLVGFISVVSDITARAKAEEALKASEEYLRMLFDTSPIGLALTRLDGTLVEVNPAFARLIGRDVEETLRLSFADITPEEYREQEQSQLAALAETGQYGPYEKEYWHKDGHRVPVCLIGRSIQRGGQSFIWSAIEDISAVRESRLLSERLQHIFDHSYDEIYIADANSLRFIQVSAGALENLGYDMDEMRRMTPLDIAPEFDLSSLQTRLQPLRTGSERLLVFETRQRRKDGSFYPVEVRLQFLPAEQESVVFGIVFDLTRAKQAEADTRASEQRFKNLVESSQDWVWEIDTQGTYTYASPRCRELLGYASEELIGSSPFDLMPPEEAARVERAFLQKVSSGQSIIGLRNINLHKDGHEVVLETSGVPFFDARGILLGYRGMDRDVTDRVRAEQAVRESEARYRAVFNQQFQFAAILAPDGTTLDINELPLQVTGYRRGDYVGRPFWRSPAWESLAEWQEIWPKRLAEAATTETPILTEDLYRTADGSTRYADVAIQAVRDEAESVIFYLIQATDTTERRRSDMERSLLLANIQRLNQELEHRVLDRTSELEAVNKELSSFAYSVSHDLRAPLRAIDGFSLALLEDYAGQLDATAVDYLQRVRGGAQRMGVLIDDLLELSRLNRIELRIETLDLGKIAKMVLDELIAGEPERKIEVSFGRDLSLRGDARLLRVLIANLLGNAFKFTAQEPLARITFDRLPEAPSVLYIRDNGVGFDMKYSGKLFGAFQRLHSTHEFPGTGIGLATVQRIVHRHGGRVWAQAKEGEGATFYFTLDTEETPVIEPAVGEGEARNAEQDAAAGRGQS